jgi:hypothetical protein
MRLLTALLIFAWGAAAWAANDPLGSGYLPSIDTTCSHYPSNVWVTGPMYKVRQDAGTVGACPGATGNKWGVFYATQNEFADFQVHLHAPGGGTAGLQVTVNSFTQTAPNPYTISSSTAALPFNVVTYREAYENVTNLTATGATFYGSTGYYPDILIPQVDPYYRQTTNAFPFSVAANQNQSIWVDVHVPAAAPPGYYSGSVQLQTGCPSACVTLATLPITLGVWQWPASGAMPASSTLPSAEGMGDNDVCIQYYGSYLSCSAFPGAGSSDGGVALTHQQLIVLMLDHRRNFGASYPPVDSGFTTWESYYAAPLNGANPAGLSLMLGGAKNNVVRFNPITTTSTTVQNWMTEFNTKGWYALNANPIFYPADEPGSTCSNWTPLTTQAALAHAATPRGQVIVTGTIENANTCSATSSVDIFIPNITNFDGIGGGGTDLASYTTWLAGGTLLLTFACLMLIARAYKDWRKDDQ